jgi:Glycosyltransferase family 87
MTATGTVPSPHRQVADTLAAQRPGQADRVAAAWVLLGLASSVLMTITGSRVADIRFHWWFRVVIGSLTTEQVLFYVAAAGLAAAWLGLARFARFDRLGPWWIALAAFLWCVPLLVGAPLFSHDLYSYLAQGTVAHIGLSPYRYAPIVLGQHGYHHLLHAVDPFWQHNTAPYGPLFLGVISLIAGLTGSHIFVGLVLVRLFDFVGLVLLAVFVPRLARRLGSDPTRAVWLAVASPLMLFQLVAPGHNDLLMAGVMVVGVTLALEGRPLLGIVVCTVAATIKLPALTAVLFVAFAWARDDASWRARIETAVKAAVATVATAGVVTLVTGFGVGWISTSLFSTPGRVRLAITPATDVSYTIGKLLTAAGASVSFGDVEPVLRVLLFAVSVIIGLALLLRTRWATLVPCLGLTLVAFAFGGPALWPWYLAWGLVLLAAWRVTQDSRVMVIAIVAASFLVKPDGILLLSRGASPFVVAVWIAIAVIAWGAWRRRPRPLARQ